MPTLLVLILTIFSVEAWAYPEFIGYKYTSCLTCHYNGQGNGPINDYGRALWGSEIAGKLFNKNRTDEELGEASGFLGKKPLPWWFRPGIKARGIYVMPNPGSGATNRFILMQADVNGAFFFDKDQKYTAVVSIGSLPEAVATGYGQSWISREHYFRWQINDQNWLYFGKMDKVFGIRTANHTAFSRDDTGLGMNDQSHGFIFHYVKEHMEATFNYFIGDQMAANKDNQHKGFSGMYEYDIGEAWRVGISLLSSKDNSTARTMLGLHSRQGFGEGVSLMFELGLKNDTPNGAETKQGYYFFSQATQRIARGYHFFVSGQGYKDNLTSDRPNNIRAGFGMLMFPLQRYEFRIEAENERKLTNGASVSPDNWGVYTQMHVSL